MDSRNRAFMEMGVPAIAQKPNLKALTKTVTRLKSTNAPFLLTMPLEVIEEGHETEIHVELLVAVEEREAWIVGDKVYFGFLIAA